MLVLIYLSYRRNTHEITSMRTSFVSFRTDKEPNEVVNTTSQFDKFVFDIDPETIKFYIGGVPNSAG